MSESYLNPSKEVPADISPPETWPEFGRIALPPSICAREEVGEAVRGIRWSFWPFTFEDYVGDEEPDLEASRHGPLARNRQVTWRRVHRTDVPPGWRVSASRGWRVDGYVRLSATKDFTKSWSRDAQRNLAAWQKKFLDTTHRIEEIEIEEFAAAYRKSFVAKRLDPELLHALERRLEQKETRPHVVLWGVRNLQTHAIVAGTAVLFSPSRNSSVQECRFMLPEGRRIHAPTALFAHWFQESIARKSGILLSTHFWQKGEPTSWKDFSEFKSHFGFEFVTYPPTLSKFVRGKFF